MMAGSDRLRWLSLPRSPDAVPEWVTTKASPSARSRMMIALAWPACVTVGLAEPQLSMRGKV
jgi:hypothetical protein